MDILEKLTLIVMVLHLVICPYTKVEESFNLQAMHDLLHHTTDLDKYDHHEYPGVVPRTFLGPLVVTTLAYPWILLAKHIDFNKFIGQYIVRITLGFLVCFSFFKYKRAVGKKLGQNTARWLLLVTMTQFHFLFYASRPLPNVFALAVALLSLQYWLLHKHARFIWTAACVSIVFRAELAVLLGMFALIELFTRRLKFGKLLLHGVAAGIFWLFLTVLVDSYFWRRQLWPEGEVFWFNAILNKSSEWGTSPFFWYFYSALPRALCSSLLFIPLAFVIDRKTIYIAWPAVVFVFLFSCLPHKELRFIIYVLPLLNTIVASVCCRLWQNRKKSFVRSILALIVFGHLCLNIVSTCGFTYMSYLNYPGGQAMAKLHQLETSENVHVHIDVASAQTGVSRFTQLHDNWRYDKTENLRSGSPQMKSFTHLLVEANHPDSSELSPYSSSHDILSMVHGFSGVKFLGRQFPPFAVQTQPKISVLKNKNK